MKTNRLYRILRIIYTTCLWKPDLFTLSFLIPWSSYWKEQWSSHHEQRKKDQPCSNCKWSFLEVSEQPFSECNLNVIVNVIGVFRGFPIFSQIDRNRWKIRLFGTYIVSNLSPGDASSPVSRTKRKPLSDQGLSSFYTKAKNHPPVIFGRVDDWFMRYCQVLALHSPFSCQYNCYSLNKNTNILLDWPVFNIFTVQSYHSIKITDLTAATDLP